MVRHPTSLVFRVQAKVEYKPHLSRKSGVVVAYFGGFWGREPAIDYSESAFHIRLSLQYDSSTKEKTREQQIRRFLSPNR